MSNLPISELIKRTEGAKSMAQYLFGQLTAEQFNWKPKEDKWSIGQLIEHLCKTIEPYFPNMEAALDPGYKSGFLAKLPFPSRYFGRMIANMTTVETKKPMKTVKMFTPSSSDIGFDVVDRFVENGDRLIDYMNEVESQDISKVIIPSPAAPIISFSLEELLKLHIDHNDRHLQQGLAVMKMENFPKRQI